MKKILFTVLGFVLFFSVTGQETTELKSLLNQLYVENNDIKKLDILSKIIEKMPSASNKKIDYILQAEKLAVDQNNTKKIVRIHEEFIRWYSIKGKYDQLIKHALLLNANAEKIKDYEGIVRSHLFVSQAFIQSNSQYDKALDYIKKGEAVILEYKINHLHADVHVQKGFIEYYKGNFEKAIAYYSKAVKSAKKFNNADVPSFYLEIGLAYTQWGKPEKAFENFDLANHYYKRFPAKSQTEKPYLYSDIALTYASIKNYPKAIEAFNKSMFFAKEVKDVKTQMENYNYLAEMYRSLKDYQKENYHLKKYYHLKDSLFTSDKNLKQAELLADYEIEKKNTLVTQKKLENIKSKNQRNIFIGITLASLSSLLFLLFFYKRIQNKNKLINKQKTSLEELNTVKDRLFAILSHDLRNPLVNLKSYLTLSTNKNLSEEKLEKYQLQTHQSLETTTNLLDNLLLWANSQLKNTKYPRISFNLEACIDEILENLKPQANQKSVFFETNLQIKNIISNQQIIEIALRNLLTNAVKFSSEKSKIKIETFEENTKTRITITDYGVGISEEKVNEILTLKSKSTLGTNKEKGSGLGLFLVMELLSKIESKLTIESQLNKGSSFIIEL